RRLTLTDLAALCLPCLESGDLGGVGALHLNQQRVVEAVLVEAAEEVEPTLPLAGLGEGVDGGGQLAVHLLNLGGAGLAGRFALLRGVGLAGHCWLLSGSGRGASMARSASSIHV